MLLLDTHIFLWFITADTKLPVHLKAAIEDETHDVCLSVASIWKIIIKHQNGSCLFQTAPINMSRAETAARYPLAGY